MARKGIHDLVSGTRFVDDSVLQPVKFRVHLELPWSMEALVCDMDEAPLISENSEFTVLQIRTPMLHCH